MTDGRRHFLQMIFLTAPSAIPLFYPLKWKKKLGLDRQDNSVTLEFRTIYPFGKKGEACQEEIKTFFAQNKPALAEILPNLNQHIISSNSIFSDTFQSQIVIFKSITSYKKWEHELTRLSLFDKDKMKDLGYRMQTIFRS